MITLSKLTSAEQALAQRVQDAATRAGIPGALLAAIVWQESRWNSRATNRTGGDGLRGGSFGLVQMSMATAKALGFAGTEAQLLDIGTNLALGAKYLADLMHEAAIGGYGFDSVVSSYNAGGSAYRRGDGKRETINQGTPAEARRYPFVNQVSYVDPVMKKIPYYAAAGFSTEAEAYTAKGGLPWVAWLAIALAIAGAL